MNSADPSWRLCFIQIENNMLILEGTYDERMIQSLRMHCGSDMFSNTRTDLKQFPAGRKPFRFYIVLSEQPAEDESDDLEKLPKADPAQTAFEIRFFDGSDHCIPLSFGKFSPIQTRYQHSYYWKDGIAVTYDETALYLHRSEKRTIFERALVREMLSEHSARGVKNFILRTAKKCFPQVSKNVWLISDRVNRAGDNGEALFRYVNQEKVTRSYFAIAKDSPDFQRLKKYGRVIPFGKAYYKFLYLTGATMISSQAEDVIFRPVKENTVAFGDLVQDTKFVFLQHGVIKDDVSDWLNRYNKNISMFVCTTRPEYESILNGAYDYDSRQVKLVGLPRHDRLKLSDGEKERKFMIADPINRDASGGEAELSATVSPGDPMTARDNRVCPEEAAEKLISVIFTWRYFLVELPDRNGARKLKPGFCESGYYRALKHLLLDQELGRCLKEHHCRMQFVLHPCMEAALPVFQELHSEWKVFVATDYTKVFQTSSLLVTDYSSVVFDFAMLYRPVLYCQTDREEFFSGQHMYQAGYFDYERDGFGEVTLSPEECVSRICTYIKSDFQLSELYAERIRKTFPFGNEGNCRRTCKAIQKMLEPS